MGNQVVKEKMQTLVVGLNKGFTLLEILIVLTIIAVSGTSFYLILNDPKPNISSLTEINNYRELSNYTGNTYGISNSNTYIFKDNAWVDINESKITNVSSIIDFFNKPIQIKSDEIFIIIAPGHEVSIKQMTFNNGESIDI